MENVSVLYFSLMNLLNKGQWQDVRHLKTLVNMLMGLILSKTVNLTEWIPFAEEVRAKIAQSLQRRYRRWLENFHIDVNQLYAPLIQEALSRWGSQTLYLALDTSVLWNRYCLIRVSIIYRGRAIPLAWLVIEHGSASVKFSVYRQILMRAAAQLPPGIKKVVLLADRGFADIQLMRLCNKLKWNFRIRIKKHFTVFWKNRKFSINDFIPTQPGKVRFLHRVALTGEKYGPLHLALARDQESGEVWLIASDQLTQIQTFVEYGYRFDIEENFLDDKSNGFQLESSCLRSAEALHRLCFVLAVATLFLVSQGTEVVEQNQRRQVDPHWFRGQSYLKIGWNWIRHSLRKGWDIISGFRLSGEPDPEPAKASQKQYLKRLTRFDYFECNILIC
jgi:hypothetical protein